MTAVTNEERKMTTGFLYDDRFLDHDAGTGHPERKERLQSAIRYLREQPWFGDLRQVAPRVAERRWIEEIHDSSYIERADEACRQGLPFLDVADVGICEASCDVAYLAAGGALELADRIVAGDVQNGFSLSRPPGHHAERNLALGFCLFNNVAVVARYLQKQHGLDKILVLDWDVHHGNGTQHSFEEDPSVFYVSTHQYPFYPGTGAASETGVGRGENATLNCPMPAGATDADYEEAFREKLLPRVDQFSPDAVIISAGFDAHVDDPLAQVCLSADFFGWMSTRMMEIADKHAGGRIISMLEGGYNVNQLPHCIEAHLKVLAGLA
jgi:acetoin utilization deacetylase AcuC-like enzyme